MAQSDVISPGKSAMSEALFGKCSFVQEEEPRSSQEVYLTLEGDAADVLTISR